jgi:hypothetical protein
MADRPTAEDIETARQELYEGSELRTPYLSGERNQYHPSRKPESRFEVQVLSWSKMRQRVEGGASAGDYARGWNDALDSLVIPARKR